MLECVIVCLLVCWPACVDSLCFGLPGFVVFFIVLSCCVVVLCLVRCAFVWCVLGNVYFCLLTGVTSTLDLANFD